jgi:carboxyl-terminal processing protease
LRPSRAGYSNVESIILHQIYRPALAKRGFSATLRRQTRYSMNVLRNLIAPLAIVLALTPDSIGAGDLDFAKIAPKVAENVGELLERAHYSKRRLDDALSKQLLKNYLERLDYNHLFFTQKDVDGFNAKYAASLDEMVLQGDTSAPVQIFAVYKKRVEDRVAKVKTQINGAFEFKSDRMVEINRLKSPWPKDEAEADQIWRDRIESEMLDRTLMVKKPATVKAGEPNDAAAKAPAPASTGKEETPVSVLSRRYDQLLRSVREQGDEDVIAGFLSVLAETYDPHSEYMSRSQLDSFNITMSLELIGIGAVLNAEEGYAKIRELVPGGPAALDGRLKVGDRVAAVAQADGDFVEALDMKLDKVVEMIRGKADTVVRLRVIPAAATDPSERKIIEITRKKVELKEQQAKGEIIERSLPDGSKQRLGWITLPSFYADMQHTKGKNSRSTTKDVRILVERMKKENIQGLIVDLRRNGGGSLDEARDLTGLFIKSGPVVQVRDSQGRVNKLTDRDRGEIFYEGPMVVLTNKLSASASEIFAAALQDYNRAVVVGDSTTFGKGTVQTMIELRDIVLPALNANASGNDAGALKLTIQKFYRVSGGSTQLQGVSADIKLPSLWDQTDIGESALKGPLPFDTIPAAGYERVERDLYRDELRRRSLARVGVDQEFQWTSEDIERAKKRIAENKVSLNEAVRRSELDEDKLRKEQRNQERLKLKPAADTIYALTLDNAEKPELELKKDESKKPDPADGTAKVADPDDEETEEAPRVDAIRSEGVNILRDLVEFTRNGVPATAATQKDKAPLPQ